MFLVFTDKYLYIYYVPCVHRQVLELVKRTATTGESNSAILIGPRGSGKSMVGIIQS